MRKIIALCLTIMLAALCAGCGGEKAAVPVSKIAWSLSEGLNEGHSYVYFQMTNNTDTPILGFRVIFRIRDGATPEEREQFLHDLQESQNFDDGFMQGFLSDLTKNGGEPVMTASGSETLQPGQTSELTLCYYMGGWTSKDLLYGDLFEAKMFVVTYEKDGKILEQTYDYDSEAYTVQPAQQPGQ